MKINHVMQQQKETALKDAVNETFADLKKVMDVLQLNEDNKKYVDLELYASRFIDNLRKIQVMLGTTKVFNAYARYLETTMETEMHERLFAMEQHYAKKQTN